MNQHTILKNSKIRVEILYCNLFCRESYKSLAKRLRLSKKIVKQIVKKAIGEGNKQVEAYKNERGKMINQ
jgi:DNA-binding Lrp family transcriptional regulator